MIRTWARFITRAAMLTIRSVMATLVLVRHGQASFGEAVYDRLSRKGEEQSRKLGEYWAREGVRFDVVYTGPRERQIHTAEIALSTMREHGASSPEPVVLAGLDEIGAEDVLKEHLPKLLLDHPEIARLFQAASARAGAFYEVFGAVSELWLRGDLQIPGLESWESFAERASRAFDEARTLATKGARVALFTSGGTIGASLQRILGTSPSVSLSLAQVVRNTALTEVLSSGNRLTLSTFNALPHLDDPSFVTYR